MQFGLFEPVEALIWPACSKVCIEFQVGMDIISSDHAPIFGAHTGDGEIGNKARGLCLCASLGIDVPPWFVIPAETARSKPWLESSQVERELLQTAEQLTGATSHAWVIRSSTSIEDSDSSAHAGEFRTERIDSLADLVSTIDAVADTRPRPSKALVPAGVIVQRYIAGAYSGVAFSCKPSGGKPEEYYCEFVEGGCEQLVSGSISPTGFSIDVRRGKVNRPKSADLPPLVFELGENLAEWIRKLETKTGKLCDVEWVHDGAKLWCVQARPITSFRLDQASVPKVCSTSWFYDERFRAPVTPITRSTLMQLIFKGALQDPVEMAGGRASPSDVFYYGGKPYVPHSFYRLMFAGIPSLVLTPYLRLLFPRRCSCADGKIPMLQMVSSLAKKMVRLLTSPSDWLCNRRIWKRFKTDLNNEMPKLNDLPSPISSNWAEHWQLLETWTERFLSTHRWSILLAEFSNGVFRLCLRVLPRRNASAVFRNFIAGLRLPTADANRALVAFAHGDLPQLEFLEKFGQRSESLDYSQPRWAEQFREPADAERFAFLDDVVMHKLGSRRGRLRIPILSEFLEMREQQRFEWEKILLLQRSMLIEMGMRLMREGRLQNVDDIWFLRWVELLDLSAGDLQIEPREVEYRRHTYRVEKSIRAPQFIPLSREEDTFRLGTQLRGLGASSGRTRGSVVVVQDSDDAHSWQGKDTILVMSNMSPADTPILLGISGLVLERGGLLSHAAIMAREYGVPLVTAASGATEALQTGMVATLDGDTGIVEFGWRNHDAK